MGNGNRGVAYRQAIRPDRVQIAQAVDATPIWLDDAPQGYADVAKGAARKCVPDPHGLITA